MMNTNALLCDLAEALASEEGRADPQGVFQSWAELAAGRISPETRYWPAEPAEPLTHRQHTALAMAVARGEVSSGELAHLAGCSRECARLTLRGLAQRGLLQARGAGKGRRYMAG